MESGRGEDTWIFGGEDFNLPGEVSLEVLKRCVSPEVGRGKKGRPALSEPGGWEGERKGRKSCLEKGVVLVG